MSATRPATRFLTLEIARFIAAFCVATTHLKFFALFNGSGVMPFNFALPPIAAVLFFFVLSGFVIQSSHGDDFEKLERLPRYVVRRLVRIFPLYWISLVPLLIVVWGHRDAGYMTQILTLSPLASWNMQELNPPAWSLRFELAFYITFGLALLPRVGGVLLPLWLLIMLAHWYPFLFHVNVKWFFDALPQGFAWFFLSVHNLLFFCGMEAAVLVRRFQPPAGVLWAVLALAAAALVAQAPYQDWGFGYPTANLEPFTGLAFGGIIYALAALERAGHLRPPAWTAVLGAISYPLYVLHYAVSYLGGKLLTDHMDGWHPPAFPLFLAVMGASLALAIALSFLVDKPVQAFARRIV